MNSFTISRTFNAPRSLVFHCWVTPEHFEHWFAPADCETKLVHADVREGGHFQLWNQWKNAQFYTKHLFRQISPIDLLVFVISFCSESGEFAKNPFAPTWPGNMLTTVTFEDEGPGTKVTVLWEPLDASDEEIAFFMNNLDGSQGGWTDTFDKVEKTVESLVPVS